ncbi:MAG: flagellar motor protein MotB, partial [Dehalococcoidia bacterium]|nr:flagellar motor protein MotB [Dehalococcoidia bacterium]
MSRKAPEAEKPENHERWIVSYADMLTLLFALFVVLYATGDPNAQKLKQVRTSIDQAFNIGVKSGESGS